MLYQKPQLYLTKPRGAILNQSNIKKAIHILGDTFCVLQFI